MGVEPRKLMKWFAWNVNRLEVLALVIFQLWAWNHKDSENML